MLYNYPLDVLTSEAPYLVIKAKDYKTLTQRASGSGGIQSHEYRLLLPTSISSSDNLSFEQQSILKGKVLSDLIAGNGQDFAAGLVNVAQELVPDPFGVRENLSAATGKGFNPKEELLFKAPDLRTHAFTFNMFARNEQEAQEIVSIIKNLRENHLFDLSRGIRTMESRLKDGDLASDDADELVLMRKSYQENLAQLLRKMKEGTYSPSSRMRKILKAFHELGRKIP